MRRSALALFDRGFWNLEGIVHCMINFLCFTALYVLYAFLIIIQQFDKDMLYKYSCGFKNGLRHCRHPPAGRNSLPTHHVLPHPDHPRPDQNRRHNTQNARSPP